MFKLTSILLLMILSATATAETASEQTATIPSFTVPELQQNNRQAEFKSILQTTGLLSIHLQSDYRHVALDGLCACAASKDDFLKLPGTDTAVLDDETTVRTTLATATVGTTPLALPLALEQTCGSDAAHAMEGLRDTVSEASRAFVEALDLLLVGSKTTTLMRDVHGKTYPTVSSLLSTANHLEHFHVYSKSVSTETTAALDWHTDAGLFLAFVPAMNCAASIADKAFYFKDAQGLTTRAIFQPDTIVFMLGAGAEHWLTQSASTQLKATKHAVQMQAGSERAWYGMST
jgi:hypothetical protein